MKKVSSKFVQYLNFGISDNVVSNLDEDEKIRLRLVNYLALLSTVNMLVYTVIYIWVDFQLFKIAILFLILTTIFNIGIIIINIQGRHLLAKLTIAIFTPLIMSFIATVVFGKAPGFHIFLFVGAMIPMFIWSYHEKIYRAVFVSSCVILYLYIDFAPPLFDPVIILPENYIIVFLKTNISVCFSSAGLAIGSYQYLYNLKEQQLIEQTKELKISQAHKDKVYSIIAHDLRGPFGAIVGLSHMLFNNYHKHTDEKRLKILRSLHGTSTSLQSLLENLLNWSRMQSGNIEKSIEHLNLKIIIEDTLALHSQLIQKKELQIGLKVKPDVYIYADHHMVSTILRNLISNAIKFTNQSGQINVYAKQIDSMICICVEDSGIGLSEKSLKNLFDIEKINKISGAHAQKGSGLGLLLCKDFVESSEGEIWVESKIGSGSKFYFTIPQSKHTQIPSNREV